MHRFLLAAFLTFAWLTVAIPVRADPPTFAQTVSVCGTPNNTPVVGQSYPVTMDQSGNFCTSASGGSGGPVTIVAPLGSHTAAASVATTINGTLPAFAATPTVTVGNASIAVTGTFFQTTQPVNATADTHAQCSALCANLVVKNAAGVLKTFEVSADSTLSGAIWYVIIYDATAAPSDGAVTPAKCYQQASGVTQMGGTLGPGGSNMTTGIVIGVSTTGCFTKTASTHAFIAADYQ